MTRTAGFLRLAVPAVVFFLPVACWPGLDEPFSAPKRALLVAAVALLLPLALLVRGVSGRRVPAFLQAVIGASLASWAWSSLLAPVVSPEALLLGIAGPLWALTLLLAPGCSRVLAGAHVAAASCVAVLALAQAAGVDPFAWLGWAPLPAGDSTRLRVYGTLGNPNFVGALLALGAPIAAALAVGARRASRSLALVGLVAMALALVATGSRAAALGLAAGGVVLALGFGERRVRLGVVAAAVALAGVAIAISPARAPGETLRGRAYVWSVAWTHAWERPATGHGPGAFELLHPGWERSARASLPPESPQRRYAGPQQHAHNDFLEALVERGVPGLVATLLVFSTAVPIARRARPLAGRAPDVTAGVAATVAACATIACLDFPLARPAEAAALWTAVALGFRVEEAETGEE